MTFKPSFESGANIIRIMFESDFKFLFLQCHLKFFKQKCAISAIKMYAKGRKTKESSCFSSTLHIKGKEVIRKAGELYSG